VATFQQQQAQRSGLRSWSRTRWLVLAVLLISVVVAVVLILTYTAVAPAAGVVAAATRPPAGLRLHQKPCRIAERVSSTAGQGPVLTGP
jgi:predicted membrane-bound mannosyltransferase